LRTASIDAPQAGVAGVDDHEVAAAVAAHSPGTVEVRRRPVAVPEACDAVDPGPVLHGAWCIGTAGMALGMHVHRDKMPAPAV